MTSNASVHVSLSGKLARGMARPAMRKSFPMNGHGIGVEVPEQDLREGRAKPGPPPDPAADRRGYPALRIQANAGRPPDA